MLKPKKDPLQKQAETLVAAAEINATSMFVPFLDKFPILKEINVDKWDFFITAAGVFIGASRLSNLYVGDAREEKLMEIVAECLVEWNGDGIRAFEDCKDLYETEYNRLAAAGYDSRFLSSDAVGKWIVWNVLGRAPESQDEIKLVRNTGSMITHAFFSWWK